MKNLKYNLIGLLILLLLLVIYGMQYSGAFLKKDSKISLDGPVSKGEGHEGKNMAFVHFTKRSMNMNDTNGKFPKENQNPTLIPQGWDPKKAGDHVLERLVKITADNVKGAHDAEMAIVGEKAYVVAEVNDRRTGEAAGWPEIYAAMSIINLGTLAVERVLTIAESGQAFENTTLPVGSCFVPRILQKDGQTLRCFFASEDPEHRESQIWYRDYDIATDSFDKDIYKALINTRAGTFDMQPKYFYADALAHGFDKPAKDYGLYLLDSFKRFNDTLYIAINNFPIGQNALATVHEDLRTFEIMGHYNEPQELRLSESSVNLLPDGTWLAICRQDGGNKNYIFTTSKDGKKWSKGSHRGFLPNGSSSKPTFDKFGDIYYLGWQEATQINGIDRSVFNIDISLDGKRWERKYRFETTKSFQYPSFFEHRGDIFLCVTQGDSRPSRKERIMFGKLECKGKFEY